MRIDQIAAIRKKMQDKLPGEIAQLLMAPDFRGNLDPSVNCKQAAVLLLLYPDQDELFTLFIKRNEYDGPHSGQISFPGGIHETTDADLAATAIRETDEETGVKGTDIELLGALTSLDIPVSNFCVTPFVGWIPYLPDFDPDPSEVQYLIRSSISLLMDPTTKQQGVLNLPRGNVKTPYFAIDQEIIWGATAMMLNEFIELLDL